MIGATLKIGLGVLSVMACFAVAVVAQREKSVLLPADQTRHWHPWGLDVTPPTWQPTATEIVEMEANFDKLKVLRPERICCRRLKSFVLEPEAYYMQYAAVSYEGRFYFYINAFKNRPGPAGWEKVWREELIWPPKGGGTNYWQALYEPATKTFSRLTYNSDE
ncbi:MAG TPA: hypothetical protein VGO43_07670 [Pyrinomonadaceae bacterium]|jgi:hypothetical protein|nr:hypothetical protein [Pyrinomonadaceae bacterium]